MTAIFGLSVSSCQSKHSLIISYQHNLHRWPLKSICKTRLASHRPIDARRFVCTSVILPSQDCWASGDSCFVRLAKQLSCADWSCGLFCTIPGKSSPWTCMFGKKAWRVCDDCAIRGFYAPDGVLGGFSLCHSARARIRTPRALSNSTFSSFDFVKWEACSW